MDDLQSMVDSLRLGAESSDNRQMEDIVQLLKGKLGLDLDQNAYRQLAESMVNLSLDKKDGSINAPPIRSTSDHGSTQAESQKVNFVSHPNSSVSSNMQHHPSLKSTSQHHMFSTTNGSPDTMQRRRGRSPAPSHSINSSSSRSSPMRHVFGGIPRGSIQTGTNSSLPLKTNSIEPKRTLSPAPTSSTYGLYQRTKLNDEKKDSDRGDLNLSGGVGLGSLVFSKSLDPVGAVSQPLGQISSRRKIDTTNDSQMRCENSNIGVGSQRPSRSVAPVSQRQRDRSRSPHPSFLHTTSNNFAPIPPSSPGFNNNLTKTSAPNSPMNTNYTTTMGTDRPPSRSGSPFNRPGLQEFDGTSATLASRSPKRDTGSSFGGASSHKPGVPLGHRRTRSIGVDADLESSRQPQVPRSFSKSPLRRPSAAPEQDSDSIRQPAPPRSCSHSPRRDHLHLPKAASLDDNFDDPNGIVMPDLLLPEFDSAASTPVRYGGQDTEMNLEEASHVKNFAVFNKKHRRVGNSGGTSLAETEFIQNDTSINRPNLKFQRVPINRSYRSDGNRIDTKPAENRNGSSISPSTDTRENIFSPMEVDILPNDDLQHTYMNPHSRRESPHFRHPSLDSHEREAMESFVPVLSGNMFPDVHDKINLLSQHSLPAANVPIDSAAVKASISNKRDEARQSYSTGDYAAAINAYTDAIKVATTNAHAIDDDTLSFLLSNRAAALLMIGAHFASVADCQLALQKVRVQNTTNTVFSTDSGLLLKVKLLTRMGRALLKLGDFESAFASFEQAVKTTDEATLITCAQHAIDAITQNQVMLSQMQTEAILGQSDARRLRESFEKLKKLLPSIDRSKYPEALNCVNNALATASGSNQLSEIKLSILASMKRWREVAGFCERLAAFNVRVDNIFREDLAIHNPFPGTTAALVLKSNLFGGSRDEDAVTRDLKLSSKAAGEAVIRLPFAVARFYLRALRLEERYPAADAALRSLESHAQIVAEHGNRDTHLQWIDMERSKLNRTKKGRERGDELFRSSDFELAAVQYTTCLTIDGEGLPPPVDGANAGGRLHAVLHCNRAACLMASKRFHAAIEEVTAALKIHSRYMKAILRRARCFARLQQTQESIAEYKRWLELVEEAAKPNYAAATQLPCLFDGPSEVKPAEVLQVRKELDELIKTKRKSETATREEADRRREREKWQENFSSSWRSGDAQQRRDQWQQDTGRRWDPFSSKGPRSQSQGRSQSNNTGSSHSSASGHNRSVSTSHADKLLDHYSVLNLQPSAKVEDIKKSFRKLAVKYHPDKNKDECATEHFLRIKLAHDTLSDPVKRKQYDDDIRIQSTAGGGVRF